MHEMPLNIEKLEMHRNRSERGDFFVPQPARLSLADGTLFYGSAPAWQTRTHGGEVVFTTGMTGYTESLTDPSYTGQILVFTYPLIGNYGINLHAAESDSICVSGVVVNELAPHYDHAQSDRSFIEWLRSQNIPIITGVDTRSLTKHLRTAGSMMGEIGPASDTLTRITIPQPTRLKKPVIYNEKTSKKVILVDCGAKENILRFLTELPVQVKRVPNDYDYTNEAFDGVLISNGPGNPGDYKATIGIAKKAFAAAKPMFGICLGSQIMGLAAGATTYKLPYGHRGHNQPCLQTTTERAYITSQNHGYAISKTSLPKEWFVSFTNLNDGSVEGIEHRTKPFFAVQFHPEACPGPTDTKWLFERFYSSL